MTAPRPEGLTDVGLHAWSELAVPDELMRPSERAAKQMARDLLALRTAAREVVEADTVMNSCALHNVKFADAYETHVAAMAKLRALIPQEDQ